MVNRFASLAVFSRVGSPVKHEITNVLPGTFSQDGVHLSDIFIANDIYLATLQDALEKLLSQMPALPVGQLSFACTST